MTSQSHEQVIFDMLIAYFDDSGTHAGSKAVMWAGFIAPEDRWAALDIEWRSKLAEWKISAFHMYECVHGLGEFDRWKQGARDRCIYEFREIILKYQMFGIGHAVSALDWNELVVGEHQKYLRTADEYCLSRCIGESGRFAKEFSPKDKLSIIFDNRQRDVPVVNRIIDFYKKGMLEDPELVSVTFQNMRSCSGLQAADMFAWESYQYAIGYIEAGGYPTASPHFQHFLDKGMLHGKILQRHGIEHLIANYEIRTD